MKYLLISVLVLSGCSANPFKPCPNDVPVARLGGCDQQGNCGAILTDGRVLRGAKQPVVGYPASGVSCEVIGHINKNAPINYNSDLFVPSE